MKKHFSVAFVVLGLIFIVPAISYAQTNQQNSQHNALVIGQLWIGPNFLCTSNGGSNPPGHSPCEGQVTPFGVQCANTGEYQHSSTTFDEQVTCNGWYWRYVWQGRFINGGYTQGLYYSEWRIR